MKKKCTNKLSLVDCSVMRMLIKSNTKQNSRYRSDYLYSCHTRKGRGAPGGGAPLWQGYI